MEQKYSACIKQLFKNGFLNCFLTSTEIEPVCETKSGTSSLIDTERDAADQINDEADQINDVADQINDALSRSHFASTELVQ